MPVLGQIRIWLMQPNVWRFLSVASTVIGLVCYARSSPFNHLFKKWNLLKIFFYIVISFIICLIVLFAKVWRRLRSHLVKAHLTVTIFTGSSVYSFFFEKALKGKPDAYSLVSCSAFAIMSLSLSRQTHCGFEVDLLYFFLGCLFVLLAKIHLLLAIFGGGGFAYCLTLLRYSLDAQPEDVDLEQGLAVGDSQQTNTGSAPLMTFDAPPQNEYLELQEHGVTQVDSHSQPANAGSALIIMPQQVNTDSAPIMTLDAPPENRDIGLEDHVVAQVDSHSQQANIDSALIMLQFMDCIKALKEKNRKVIRMLINVKVPQLQTDPNLVMDALQSKIIDDLHETVKLMVAAGFEEECCHLYSNCRSEFLQECMSRFGLQELNTEDVDKMERIQRWIKASNIAFKLLFPNERRLCDLIFFGFSPAADLSFKEVCRELTNHLLNFANTCAIESRLPYLLRGSLRVFDTLNDLIPKFESLFSNQYSVSLMNEAITVRKRLGEAIRGILRGIFMELENLIRLDTAQPTVPDGGIHPITDKVMYCLGEILEARDTLEKVFEEYPADREGTSSSLSVHMASIIELIETSLEAMSKNYTDPALGYVFMMNNWRCIEGRAKYLLGNEWNRKYAGKVWLNRHHYQSSSWKKVLNSLKLDNNEPESMKEKLNLFNMLFQEICNVQSTWFVYDKQLREQIRISVEETLVPAYRNFIKRFRNVVGRHAEKHIKYEISHIQNRLKHLFRGSD